MTLSEYVSWNWPGLALVLAVVVGVPAVLIGWRGR